MLSERPSVELSFARSGAGRLVLVRVGRLSVLADVERLNAQVFSAIRASGPGVFVCSDQRLATPLPQKLADCFSHGMRLANPSIARSAILVDPANTTYNLLVDRVVRCAGGDSRRVFVSRADLEAWLAPQLTDLECADVRRFLSSSW